MSFARATPPQVDVAAFATFLEAQRDDRLWELLGGRIVAMTNPSLAHEEIVQNVATALRAALPADRSCRLAQGSVRVQASDDHSETTSARPDLMVWCGAMDPHRHHVTTPMLIVEVLSPSTIDRDRGEKLAFYQQAFPTLRHIVLVYQDELRVEAYARTAEGWSRDIHRQPSAVLSLDALGLTIPLATIYAGTSLAEAG